jgi:threonine/homoserine/homoserine lactone efflux protein
MFDSRLFFLFFTAAILLAMTPGPGMFYVLSRSLAGGQKEGLLSAAGTFAGGLVHVIAAAVGVSAVLATSSVAFRGLKYAGAIYLVLLGIKVVRSRNLPLAELSANLNPKRTLRQGVLTEVLNPKTALFFLSFIPQFINPSKGTVMLQFLFLGTVSVSLNTIADLVVVTLAAPIGARLRSSLRFGRNQRVFSGIAMMGLGAYLALGDSK